LKRRLAKNVARDVLFDLEADLRDVHRMTQICTALIEHNTTPKLIAVAVYFATSMAFDLEKKYDEALGKAGIKTGTKERIEA
jgi:hypothetical protein